MIVLKMKVWDSNGGYYNGTIQGPAYNKGYILTDHTGLFVTYAVLRDDISHDLDGYFNGNFGGINYNSVASSYHTVPAIWSHIPSATVFYISTHTSPDVFGDCYDDGGGDALSYYGNQAQTVQSAVALKSSSGLPPYNLVYVDGCNSAGNLNGGNTIVGHGPGAFGLGTAFSDRAFLGWENFTSGSLNTNWTEAIWERLCRGEGLYDAATDTLERTMIPRGPVTDTFPYLPQQDITPLIVGDPLMKLHDVYLGTAQGQWFRPLK